jgi:hypothetical protein
MPEGPEVRRYADQLDKALGGQPICAIDARTKAAKAWLAEHPSTLLERRVESVRSRGKNLYARVEGGYYFYSHLMMWGRWEVVPNEGEIARDRRERARIAVPQCVAILLSAPVFEIGHGDPLTENEYLASLGPDALPYLDEGDFNESEFRKRLGAPEHAERTIGPLCSTRPSWRIGQLPARRNSLQVPHRPVEMRARPERSRTREAVPRRAANHASRLSRLAAPPRRQQRATRCATTNRWCAVPMSNGTRGITCFAAPICRASIAADTIRQKRQFTRVLEDGEKTRIIYFCPTCQKTTVELKPLRAKRPRVPSGLKRTLCGLRATSVTNGCACPPAPHCHSFAASNGCQP